MTENPYQSPHQTGYIPSFPPLMTWRKGIAIVAGTTAAIGLLGLTIGFLIGRFAPGYYRAVFPRVDDARFDPVALGVGLGLTQGTAAGVALGLTIVVVIAWFKLRERRLFVERREVP